MKLLRKSNFVRISDSGPDSYFENGPKSEIRTSENELLRFSGPTKDPCVTQAVYHHLEIVAM